jgi:hypothetical protein
MSRLRSNTLLILIFGSLFLTVASTSAATADTQAPPAPPSALGDPPGCANPCPQYTYQLGYRVDDGTIDSVESLDPKSSGTGLILEPGEAVLDITGDPRLLDIMYQMDAFAVQDGQVVQVREIVAATPTSADELTVAASVPNGQHEGGWTAISIAVALTMASGLFLINRRSRARPPRKDVPTR